MQYGTTNTNIAKDSKIGKILTNSSAEINNYNVFAITLKINLDSTAYYETYVFNRGYNTRQFFEIANYWYGLAISLSNTTFSVSSKRGYQLNDSIVSNVASIYQIHGIG